MGASSLGIGILPTYEQIGLWAPCLLVVLRLIQGLAIGGELPSTYVYISETLTKKQGTGFGITMAGVNSGLLLGMLVNELINYFLLPEDIIAYGWRIPFIFGGLLCIISYRIRKTLSETVAFQKIHDKPAFPLLHLLKNNLKTVLMGTAITSIMSGLVVVAIIYMPTYLNKILNVNLSWVSHCTVIGMVANVLTIYGTGKLANRINPLTILLNLLLFSVILIPTSYWLISLQEFSLMLGIVILCVLEGVAAVIIPLCLCQLFATPIRLTGVALCYNVGFTLFGGMAPVVISALINLGYDIYLTPILYLLVIVFVCSTGLTFLKRYNRTLQSEVAIH
jgi:MFS family permease